MTKAIALAVMVAFAPVAALAANADAPNTNVDKSNDKGGPTGNSQVDKLNSGQLDSNQKPGQATAPNPAPPAK